MPDNDLGQARESAPAPSAEERALPGAPGREAFLGYKQLPQEEPAETYGASDDELRRAARDYAAERGTERSEPVEETPETPDDGSKYALSVKDAAAQLSAKHRAEDNAAAVAQLNSTQSEVDVARYLTHAVNAGQISAEAARAIESEVNQAAAQGKLDELHAEQPAQAESPQPEAPTEQPTPGVSEKVRAMLADPELRQVLEPSLMQAEAARHQYAHATQELADVTTAAVLASWPELRGLTAQTLPVALAAIGRENPEKAIAIKAHLDQATAILQASHQAKAAQAQQAQAQFSQWAKSQDDAFDKSLGAEITPEKKIAIQKEIYSAAQESGISQEQLNQLWQTNPVLRSAGFQKMMHDAALYRLAKRTATAEPASRSRIPPVQKPGVARSRSEIAEADLGELRSALRNSKGSAQIKAAVALHQAQRRARG